MTFTGASAERLRLLGGWRAGLLLAGAAVACGNTSNGGRARSGGQAGSGVAAAGADTAGGGGTPASAGAGDAARGGRGALSIGGSGALSSAGGTGAETTGTAGAADVDDMSACAKWSQTSHALPAVRLQLLSAPVFHRLPQSSGSRQTPVSFDFTAQKNVKPSNMRTEGRTVCV